MNTHVNKTTDNTSKSAANQLTAKDNGTEEAQSLPAVGGIHQLQQMADGSPQMAQLRSVQSMANQNKSLLSMPSVSPVVQKKENNTGLPDQLKSGVENLSGIGMDDVKVHTNSPMPAQLNAHAYAQGTDIHVAPGQEKHLPHEAWHVVQQKQGRVQATTQMKGMAVNDDTSLETDADTMGAKAMLIDTSSPSQPAQLLSISTPVLQGAFTEGDPSTYDADGGHGYGDHGWLTTELQHKVRLETGTSPSGRVADIPDASSKFASSAIMTNAIALAIADRAKPSVVDKTGKKGGKKARITLAYSTAGAGISYSLDKSKVPPAVVSSTVDWVVIVLKNPPGYDEIVTMFPGSAKPGGTDN